MKKNIAVLFGGCSPEYGVSLKSAYSVLAAIDKEKYQVTPIGINKEGRWFHYCGSYDLILEDTWQQASLCNPAFLSPDRKIHGMGEETENGLSYTRLDGVFPVLHGKNGEDGSVQGLAELAGIPVIGCGCLSSALCMDKYRAHQIAAAKGIKVPAAAYFDHKPGKEELEESIKTLSFPLFVKPLRAGSSFGITMVHQMQELSAAVDTAFTFDSQITIEESIPGFEVGCAILGDRDLTLGRVDAIQLSAGFFDYTEKYTQKTSKILMPAPVSPAKEKEIQKTAVSIYRALGCSGFARVDMFLTPEGHIVFNEVNTIPGFTDLSRYPKMLTAIGMSYAEILSKLIETGVAS